LDVCRPAGQKTFCESAYGANHACSSRFGDASERIKLVRQRAVNSFDLVGINPRFAAVENLPNSRCYRDRQTLKAGPQIHVHYGILCTHSPSSGISDCTLLGVDANARFVPAASVFAIDAPRTTSLAAILMTFWASIPSSRDHIFISDDYGPNGPPNTV
jgi:hypothetical protein